MNTKVLFSAEITDGYSLRNSISMIKNEQDVQLLERLAFMSRR